MASVHGTEVMEFESLLFVCNAGKGPISPFQRTACGLFVWQNQIQVNSINVMNWNCALFGCCAP